VLDEVWKKCVVQENADFVAFDSSSLTSQPLGLQRNLLRRAMERIHPQPLDLGYETLERAVRFLGGTTQSARLDIAGNLHLLREGMLLYVVTGDSTLPVERWPQIPDGSPAIALNVPGLAVLSGGWKLNCERWNIASLAMEQARGNSDPFQVWLDAKALSTKLELRVRSDGDRFEPLGMNGQVMKLSDFFINVKLPQRARDRWPLLCLGETIVWIPGYRPAHAFRLTDTTRQVLYFSLTRG
jgi:tRNA(Ile)-lysidine synthase